MAIALRTGAAAAWTTGTTVSTASMSLTAGDIIVCSCTGNPSTLSVTFSKSAGTGAIGSFTTRTRITSGNIGLTVGYASVTTTGTVTITATYSTTVTNGNLAVEAYSGASGVKGGTGGSGSTGTDATLSITITYANSWGVFAVGQIGNNPGVPTNGTNCVVERSNSSNITGTTNDLSLGLGSNEAATAAGSLAMHMTKANNVTYVADIIELVQQWTISAAGGASGGQTDQVLTNFTAKTVTESGSTTQRVLTNLKSVGVAMSAASAQVGGLVKAVTETEAGAAVARVLTNLKAVTVTAAASIAKQVLTNFKSVIGTEGASATARVATNVKGTSVSFAGSASGRVATNLKAVGALMGASAVAIAGGGGGGGGLTDGDSVQCVQVGGIECCVTIDSGTAVKVVTESVKQISVVQVGGTPIKVTI